ncbi:electron transfer flavoprotein beta subunit [Desulfocicer vacuolatum DSM 3385]|uniref:Electron transfer flavoprotein beta subunit n=1 Tax=Desulfocicer vacuolatum DSM 3385 TaxID=1121400 RepID=A0A1W2CAU6_9BACT|nr:electron transfer flavoprotein subunit beta/FixA family protein [Desulfocicer vacuolatum]SMC82290.1 electron transfer flavoprotein beta subunit [Desulfocicer vacuolatum DSM 3385]
MDMKIYVCVKHVPDSAANIAVKDGNTIDDKISFLLNPYDEHAVTEAAALKKHLGRGEVIAISLGTEDVEKTLRSAMAMGADRSILVKTDRQRDSIFTARALKAAIDQDGSPAIIFTGRESIDMEGMQTMFRLGAAFGFPVASNVIKFTPEKNSATVESQTEGGGKNIYHLSMPCVLGVGRGINTPSYPTFPDVVKARKKEVKTIDVKDLNITPSPSSMSVISLEPFAQERRAREITGTPAEQVQTLVNILRNEAKVLN